MIPKAGVDDVMDFSVAEIQTSNTYAFNITKQRLMGKVDELEAMRQAIYLILNVERYQHVIYSWNYGIELSDLYGKHHSYIIPEVKRRITEALMQDDRITAVDSFLFKTEKNKITATFKVTTIFGVVEADKAVST